jgi:hypothetical protein
MADMVAGNPRANRKVLCVAVALLFIALFSIAFIALLRKRTNPQKEPPLHPANSIATDNSSGDEPGVSGSRAHHRSQAAVASEVTQLRSARKPYKASSKTRSSSMWSPA